MTHLLRVKVPFVFVIKFEVAVITVHWLLIHLETDISAQGERGLQQVLVVGPSTNQLITHSVVDVE